MRKAATWVILREDGKFLMIKRGSWARSYPWTWFFPWWMCDPWETPEQNVIREVFEETWLNFVPEKIIHEHKTPEVERTRFIWKATWQIKIQDEECDWYAWFSYEEALKVPIAFEWIEHIKHLKENWHI